MIVARKMPEFYIIIARKIFSRILGGHLPPLPHVPRLLRLWELFLSHSVVGRWNSLDQNMVNAASTIPMPSRGDLIN